MFPMFTSILGELTHPPQFPSTILLLWFIAIFKYNNLWQKYIFEFWKCSHESVVSSHLHINLYNMQAHDEQHEEQGLFSSGPSKLILTNHHQFWSLFIIIAKESKLHSASHLFYLHWKLVPNTTKMLKLLLKTIFSGCMKRIISLSF